MLNKIKDHFKSFDKYSFTERLTMAGLTALAISFIFVLFGPIDIYANNMQEFAFVIKDFLPLTLCCFLLAFVVMTAVMLVFNHLLLNAITALGVSAILASYFENMILHTVTFVAGDATTDGTDSMYKSLKLCLIFVVAFIVLSVLLAKKWKNVLIFLCVLLIGMNGASLVTDCIKYNLFNDKSFTTQNVMTCDELLNAGDENIIYILFDRFDNSFVNKVKEKDPEFFDDLEGFTYFDSATSMYTRTYPAAANMISGVDYTLQCSPTEYFDEAYGKSPFLKDLKANGYDINLFIQRYYGYDDANSLKGIANNVDSISGYTPNKKGIFKYLAKLSFARSFSFTLTRVMYMNANQGKKTALSSFNCDKEIYDVDDLELNSKITKGNATNTGSKKYSFIQMHGSHTPYIVGEDGKYSEDASSYTQTKGEFLMLKEYFNQLKALGVYDNSTIIISGDHGLPYGETTPLHEQVDQGVTTAIFVKPRNAENEKLATSHAQVSIANTIPAIVKDAKLNTSTDYGKGLFDVAEDEQTQRTFYQSIYSSADHKLKLNKYKITGDAHDISNWHFEETINSDYQWY